MARTRIPNIDIASVGADDPGRKPSIERLGYNHETSDEQEVSDEDRSEDETIVIQPDDIDEQNDGREDRDTEDGLDPTDESIREGVEDAVTEEEPENLDRLPVFDRGSVPPKICR